jgi:hypothetical protein
MYLEIRMSIYFGRFSAFIQAVVQAPGEPPPGDPRMTDNGADALSGQTKKWRPGSDPRPPKRILRGFPVARYYLRRTIFFMFS